VLSGVCWTLREAGLGNEAEDFLKRAVARSSFDDMVRLAGEYVEIRWGRPMGRWRRGVSRGGRTPIRP